MAIELRQPSGIDEWRRVVHALQAGTSITGQEAYLVASTVPPLYRVQGVVGSEAEARRLAASDVEAALGWSKQERNQRVIWGPIQLPDPGPKIRIEPCDHPYWTEMWRPPPNRPPARVADPVLGEVTRIELRIEWRRGEVEDGATWVMAPGTDAIFLTRGALETFAYPHLQAVFGNDYVRELHSRLGR
jgi:hypothetical protein